MENLLRYYDKITISYSKSDLSVLSKDGKKEAKIKGYKIGFSQDNYTYCITCSLEDLKELRKVIRKAIRNEIK